MITIDYASKLDMMDDDRDIEGYEQTVICDECKHFISMHDDRKGCLVIDCKCGHNPNDEDKTI